MFRLALTPCTPANNKQTKSCSCLMKHRDRTLNQGLCLWLSLTESTHEVRSYNASYSPPPAPPPPYHPHPPQMNSLLSLRRSSAQSEIETLQQITVKRKCSQSVSREGLDNQRVTDQEHTVKSEDKQKKRSKQLIHGTDLLFGTTTHL